ncbi:YncE family protein [Roseimaritima ulvae]|uniref:YncE family protein n=1 Tax=Roseimaritima ulvae TaxID=980254 RepID=UPI00082B9A86|nr:hypothetical protein [Roseimaritima ulvae]
MFALVILSLVACTVGYAQPADQQATAPSPSALLATATPEGGTTCWLVQESTGRVFAALADSDQVVEYESTGKEVRRFTVGMAPQEMVLKANQLVVACTKSPALHFVDLDANQVVGELPFVGTGPLALFASQADNPYVYCFANATSSSSSVEVYQVDVSARSIRNQTSAYRWGQNSARHVAMSPNGRWIVLDARGRSSPSGADLMRVDEDAFTFTQVRNHHDSFGQMVAGPFNRYWTFGKQLYPLDITAPLRTFSGSVVRIHPRYDLAASVDASEPNRCYLQRFRDATDIAKLELPEPEVPKTTRSGRSRSRVPVYDRFVRFDLQRDLVFVGTQRRGYWIDLKTYQASLSPQRMILAPSAVTALVGSPLQIALEISNLEQSATVQLVKSSGPESLTITDGTLSWTPTAEDVGAQDVVIELKSATDDEVLDTCRISLQVELPRIELGFVAKTMVLSPDKRYAVVWGPSPGQEQRHPAHSGSDEIAVLDISQRKILSHKTIPPGIRCAAIDDKYVFVSPNSGNLFYRLDHKLENQKRQFLQSAPQQLIRFADDRLAVIGDKQETFDTEDMSAAPMPTLSGLDPRGVVVRLLGQRRIEWGGRLLDRETGELLRVDPGMYLPPLIGPPQVTYRRPQNDGLVAWGRKLNNQALMSEQGNMISQFTHSSHDRQATLSERWPMAVLVAAVQDPQTRENRLTMEFRNLLEGTVMHSSVLDVFPPNRQNVNFYGMRQTLQVLDDQILYLHQDKLLFAKIPKAIAQAMPVPLHFKAKQESEIKVDGMVKVPLKVGGDNTELTFSLLNESPHLQLDANTGVLEVDTAKLWATLNVHASNSPHLLERPPLSWLKAAENAKRYRALTNKNLPAGTMAANLPISVAVQDSEGQQAKLTFGVIVVGPRQAFDTAMAKRAAAEKERQEQMREAQRVRQQQMAEARAARAEAQQAEPGTPEARLEVLEAKVRRLEAALDSILKQQSR